MEGYTGLDYAFGKANVDATTGIRYGVLNQGEILQAWVDASEPIYTNDCPYCGAALDDCVIEGETCPECDAELASGDFDDAVCLGFELDDNEYKATCGEDGDIFIMKSPYYTLCGYCSPCAPGAGDLSAPMDNGIRAYCFGHDWFEGGKAPYRVFRVDDDTEVFPD